MDDKEKSQLTMSELIQPFYDEEVEPRSLEPEEFLPGEDVNNDEFFLFLYYGEDLDARERVPIDELLPGRIREREPTASTVDSPMRKVKVKESSLISRIRDKVTKPLQRHESLRVRSPSPRPFTRQLSSDRPSRVPRPVTTNPQDRSREASRERITRPSSRASSLTRQNSTERTGRPPSIRRPATLSPQTSQQNVIKPSKSNLRPPSKTESVTKKRTSELTVPSQCRIPTVTPEKPPPPPPRRPRSTSRTRHLDNCRTAVMNQSSSVVNETKLEQSKCHQSKILSALNREKKKSEEATVKNATLLLIMSVAIFFLVVPSKRE